MMVWTWQQAFSVSHCSKEFNLFQYWNLAMCSETMEQNFNFSPDSTVKIEFLG